MQVAEEVVATRVARRGGSWRLFVADDLALLPDSTASALKEAQDRTRDAGPGALTVAIAYDGREEVVHAVRSALYEAADSGRTIDQVAATLDEQDVAQHLYLPSLPEPDLIIRTSGEQRLSNFLLWQGVHARLHFTDVYWPDFRYIDLLRALRSFADREG